LGDLLGIPVRTSSKADASPFHIRDKPPTVLFDLLLAQVIAGSNQVRPFRLQSWRDLETSLLDLFLNFPRSINETLVAA
jgi:hypothetical protein